MISKRQFCISVFAVPMILYFIIFRYLVKYLSRDIWDRELQSSEDINIVVMGKTKVGKTSVIKNIIRHLEQRGEDQNKSLYEYRERTTRHSPPLPVSTPLRREAMNLGDVFVLVFAIDDPNSFDFVEMLKDELCQIKGYDVPIIVVGNKSDLRKKNVKSGGSETGKHVSYAFADLMVSVDWDKTYEEVSVKKNSGFESLLSSIEKNERLFKQ